MVKRPIWGFPSSESMLPGAGAAERTLEEGAM